MAGASEIRAGGAFVEVYVKDQRFRSELGKAQSAFASFSRAIQQQLARISPTAAVAFGRISAVIGRSISTFRTFSTATKSILTSVSSTISSFTRVVRRLFLGITIGAASSILVFRDWLSWASELQEIAVRTRSNIFSLAFTETGTLAAGNTLQDLGEAIDLVADKFERLNFSEILPNLGIAPHIINQIIELQQQYNQELRQGTVNSVLYLTAVDRLISTVADRTQRIVLAQIFFGDKFEAALKYIEQFDKIFAFRTFASSFFVFTPQTMGHFIDNVHKLNSALTILKIAWRNLTTIFVATYGNLFVEWVLAFATITKYATHLIEMLRRAFPIFDAISITLVRLARSIQYLDWGQGLDAVKDFMEYIKVSALGVARIVFRAFISLLDLLLLYLLAKVDAFIKGMLRPIRDGMLNIVGFFSALLNTYGLMIDSINNALYDSFHTIIRGFGHFIWTIARILENTLTGITDKIVEFVKWPFGREVVARQQAGARGIISTFLLPLRSTGEYIYNNPEIIPRPVPRFNAQRGAQVITQTIVDQINNAFSPININADVMFFALLRQIADDSLSLNADLREIINKMKTQLLPEIGMPYEFEKAIPRPHKISPPPLEAFIGQARVNLAREATREVRGMFNPFAVRAAGVGSPTVRRQIQLLERIVEEARRLREEFINRLPLVFE